MNRRQVADQLLDNTFKTMTVAFKTSANAWTSRYSFDTSCFAHVDNVMVTFNTEVDGGGDIVYTHDVDANKNSFYGGVSDSQFTVSFNDNPSKNKVYKAVSLEGANLSEASSSFVANLSPDFNQAREGQVFESFLEKGGVFYGGLTKSNLTDPTNNLKAVAGIRRVKRLTSTPGPTSANNGLLSFQGYTVQQDSFNKIFFEVTPYPHYKQLGSASGDQVVSKYVLGFLTENGVELRAPRVDINPDFTFSLDTESDLVSGRQETFANQPDGLVNTSGVSKYRDHIVVRANDSLVGNVPFGVSANFYKVTAFVNAMNDYISDGNEVMLFMITDDRINGADPRGQYGDLTVSIPAEDFEIFAVNMEYSPTELDHSKG